MTWDIFDAINKNRQSNIVAWIAKEKISKPLVARLNQKIDMLITAGPDLSPQLLAGPIKSKRNKRLVSHVYKLKIKGDRMLRPMLCRGPIDTSREFTLLLGAIEVGDVLDTDAEEAENIRLAIVANPNARKPHERYR